LDLRLCYNNFEGDGIMSKGERKSIIRYILDVYWFIKKRVRLFFWLTMILLILAIGIFIYIRTASFQNVWIAFIVGPGIMLLTLIALKISRYEDKHGLTHHKYQNGVYVHTTFPMKKDTNKKKKE